MKRVLAALTAAAMVVGLTGCGEINKDLQVQNSSSELYVQEDMYFSMEYITMTMDALGEVIDRIYYLGDARCSDEEILDKLNEYRGNPENSQYTECMGFSVDFHGSKQPVVVIRKLFGDGWDLGSEVHDFQFWFARTDGGEWEKVYMGDTDIREIE